MSNICETQALKLNSAIYSIYLHPDISRFTAMENMTFSIDYWTSVPPTFLFVITEICVF